MQFYDRSDIKFTMILKKPVAQRAFEHLKQKKQSHSKMMNIEYNYYNIQGYLKSYSILSNKEKQLLFKFRTRMAEVKNNFRNMFDNQCCTLCKENNEDQYHLLNCTALGNNTTQKKQEALAKLPMKIW